VCSNRHIPPLSGHQRVTGPVTRWAIDPSSRATVPLPTDGIKEGPRRVPRRPALVACARDPPKGTRTPTGPQVVRCQLPKPILLFLHSSSSPTRWHAAVLSLFPYPPSLICMLSHGRRQGTRQTSSALPANLLLLRAVHSNALFRFIASLIWPLPFPPPSRTLSLLTSRMPPPPVCDASVTLGGPFSEVNAAPTNLSAHIVKLRPGLLAYL